MKNGNFKRKLALERARRVSLKETRPTKDIPNESAPTPVVDESWRGPDTQKGRWVRYLETACGGREALGMAPADFEVLADWCAMGHLPSMRRMQRHFESRVSPEAKARLDSYLADEGASQQEWDAWLEARPEDCFNVRAHAFWLCRLAQFGNEASGAILAQRPRLETVAFMKYHPVYGTRWQARYSPGEAGAARLGLLDLSTAKGDLPTRNIEDGIDRVENYIGDTGRDETGFGMEEEYDFFYFDEYYRLLKALRGWSNRDVRMREERILSACREKKQAFIEERAAFMRLHGGDGAPC